MNPSRDDKGRLLPGHRGLKKKGTVHVATLEVREKIAQFLQAKAYELPSIWSKLSHREKARMFVELSKFIVPQQRDVTINTQPTQEAVRQLFDFSDSEDVTLWIEETKSKVFPEQETKKLG